MGGSVREGCIIMPTSRRSSTWGMYMDVQQETCIYSATLTEPVYSQHPIQLYIIT